MSVNLYVVLPGSNAPDVAAWNRALADVKVPLRFDETCDLRHINGFLPAKLEGRDTGFEFSMGDAGDLGGLDEQFPALADISPDTPIVYSMDIGSPLDETIAAFLAASVLVSRFGGVALDPQGGTVLSREDLDAALRQLSSFSRS